MNTEHPAWEHRPDGSRARITNGIKIIVRGSRRRAAIAHLVTWQEGATTCILGLDRSCRPVYTTALN